jgi:hypothetical protein
VQVQNHQGVYFPAKLPEFLRWFPKNDTYQQQAESICAATKTFHDYPGGGVYPWVEVTTGTPAGTVTSTPAIGSAMSGMATMTTVTHDPQYLSWADQKADFVWQQRPNPALPILVEVLSPTGYPTPVTSDTDTLYYVRTLYDLWLLLEPFPAWRDKAAKYRDQALAVTNQWYEAGWWSSYGHFTRKLNFDGTPADTRLYGDGKANTLYILVWAYRTTGDIKYLDRLKTAWSNLLARSHNGTGLIDELFDSGVGNGTLDDNLQLGLLDVLTFAYEASGDPVFLAYAKAQADGVLALGDTAFAHTSPENVGPPLLRFALAEQKIWRLEVKMGERDRSIIIRNSQGSEVLSTQVPADFAIVFMPQGVYEMTVDGRTRNINLRSNRTIVFPE